MEKQRITWINRESKTSSAGKPYTSVSIKTDRHGQDYIRGFGNKNNTDWKVGDEIEIEVTQKEINGKIYKNFEIPKGSERLEGIEVVQISLMRIEHNMKLYLEEIISLLKKDENQPHF